MLEQDGKGKGAHFETTQKFLKITSDQPKTSAHQNRMNSHWIPHKFLGQSETLLTCVLEHWASSTPVIWDLDPGIRQAVAIWIDATKEKQCAIHVVQQSLAGWWPNRKKIHRNSGNYLQESFHWIFKSCSFTDFKIFKLAQGLTKTRLSMVNPLGFSPLLSKWIAAPWNSGIALQLRRFPQYVHQAFSCHNIWRREFSDWSNISWDCKEREGKATYPDFSGFPIKKMLQMRPKLKNMCSPWGRSRVISDPFMHILLTKNISQVLHGSWNKAPETNKETHLITAWEFDVKCHKMSQVFQVLLLVSKTMHCKGIFCVSPSIAIICSAGENKDRCREHLMHWFNKADAHKNIPALNRTQKSGTRFNILNEACTPQTPAVPLACTTPLANTPRLSKPCGPDLKGFESGLAGKNAAICWKRDGAV